MLFAKKATIWKLKWQYHAEEQLIPLHLRNRISLVLYRNGAQTALSEEKRKTVISSKAFLARNPFKKKKPSENAFHFHATFSFQRRADDPNVGPGKEERMILHEVMQSNQTGIT